jgi:starch phosphorylase
MEIGLESGLPTYAGGLGVLAGDTLRAAADIGLSMVGVSLVHRKGYFRQSLDDRGNQTESLAPWDPAAHLESTPIRVNVPLRGRTVWVRAWRYRVTGWTGREVPVYLLDTDLAENDAADRVLTDCLYGGDAEYRLAQEAVLGLGGIAVLRALGHDGRSTLYHMNEGHSALLTVALAEEFSGATGPAAATEAARDEVRTRCVFTTHTPVPAGHDQFSGELARGVLGEERAGFLEAGHCCMAGTLNMTYLALHHSRYVNGVAMRHGEISRGMFPGYPINSITNGVHAVTWAADPWRALFDLRIPEWRLDNLYLRYASSIALTEILQAHAECKGNLVAEAHRRSGAKLQSQILTLGFARRATPYKRADLLFNDIERLRRIARTAGPIQVIFAGKAHPRDEAGKDLIRQVFSAMAKLRDVMTVVYLEEYDMALARTLCAGVDVWLNTPQKPQEASGTSGMKAALNGVPSFSVLDGWWLEGCHEGITGWAIGEDGGLPSDTARESASLYDKLEYVIAPLFYQRPMAFAEVMRSAIALNGSFFNAQRMLFQYLRNAYLPGDRPGRPDPAIPALAPYLTGGP